MGMAFPQFVGRDEIEKVQIQPAEDDIGAFDGELPLAAEQMVHVRLREPGEPCESTLGRVAATYAVAKIADEPSPQLVEGHSRLYFSEK
jgi:hypothetical protein